MAALTPLNLQQCCQLQPSLTGYVKDNIYNVAMFVQCYKVRTLDPEIHYIFKGYLHIVRHLAHYF